MASWVSTLARSEATETGGAGSSQDRSQAGAKAGRRASRLTEHEGLLRVQPCDGQGPALARAALRGGGLGLSEKRQSIPAEKLSYKYAQGVAPGQLRTRRPTLSLSIIGRPILSLSISIISMTAYLIIVHLTAYRITVRLAAHLITVNRIGA